MAEQFLYHRVPKDMAGDSLYPLNQLKATMPEIYAEKIKKYRDREYLLEDVIPILNCKWNDVLHLTAVHPQKLLAALKSTGHNPPPQKFFQIDTSQFQPENTVIYWYRQSDREHKFIA